MRGTAWGLQPSPLPRRRPLLPVGFQVPPGSGPVAAPGRWRERGRHTQGKLSSTDAPLSLQLLGTWVPVSRPLCTGPMQTPPAPGEWPPQPSQHLLGPSHSPPHCISFVTLEPRHPLSLETPHSTDSGPSPSTLGGISQTPPSVAPSGQPTPCRHRPVGLTHSASSTPSFSPCGIKNSLIHPDPPRWLSLGQCHPGQGVCRGD